MREDFAHLSPEQQQLVELLLRQANIDPAALHKPAQQPDAQEIPLSFSQQRVWFLEQLHQGNPAYNIPIARKLLGQLDSAALEQSINTIIQRHDSLRAAVIDNAGQPTQLIRPYTPVALRLITLDHLPAAERLDEALRIIVEEAYRPFDLEQGVLLRPVLIRLAATEHILLITTHHFAADGWSVRVLMRELTSLYAAAVRRQAAPLPALRMQFADYARWQRQALSSAEQEAQLAYWRNQLRGELPILNLPTDYPRPPLQSVRGAHVPFVLSADLTAELHNLSRQQRCTLFMTLAAAFLVLLYHYTQQDDIMLATAVSNRNRPETEDLIGFFANTLLLRNNLAGNPSFATLLERVRGVCLGAYANQDIPFEMLVEQLQPDRDLSRTPLFQVLFVLQNAPSEVVELPGVSMSALDIPSKTARFDLELAMAESEHGLRGRLEYNADLFASTTIERLAKHYINIVSAVVRNPNQPIATLRYFSADEMDQLLVRWNHTTVLATPDSCVHRLIERQVERTPQAIAVDDGTQRLSYAELNQRANGLAAKLRQSGVRPNRCVGICLERSVDLVVGLLAILKAGGAYVVLDPAYPRERLEFMLGHQELQVLITAPALQERLPDSTVPIVYLEGAQGLDLSLANPDPASGAQPDDMLYVIYTSGSTGQPKGAAVYHRSFVNLLHWFVRDFAINATDAVLLVSALSFDLTQKNVFAPLMVGATLHLWPAEHYDPQAIAQAIAAKQITLLNCTPSAFYPLVDEATAPELARLASLRYVFLGGEAIAAGRLASWINAASNRASVVNTYGPTECTDICAFHCLEPEAYTSAAPVPLGKPIPNVQLYVLGRNMELVPRGVPGELAIAGAGVGLGYINDPALTAAKFLPNPYSQVPGARLYRSGDMVRWRADGTLEFLGRRDHQVKIRGFRIELGDIEAVVREHPGVREVAVVAQAETAEQQRLVAFVMPHQAQTALSYTPPEPAAIEQWLADQRRMTLPNGLIVAHQNSIQTNILYSEIFEAAIYLRHGITLNDGDCVFDVGANIGMFTLFAHQRWRNMRIFAFEPSPPTYAILRANAGLYGMNAELFNCGLAAQPGEAVFRYYPHMSGMSGFFADTHIDRDAFTTMVLDQRQPNQNTGDQALPRQELQQFTSELFAESQEYTCQLRTLSEIIDAYQIERIDLLKIDAEKSEVDILAGIAPEHWARIRQFVLEVHSQPLLEQVTQLLTQHGYHFEISASEEAHSSDNPEETYQLFMVYARQASAVASATATDAAPSATIPAPSPADLRHFVRARLPDYMVPSAFVLLDSFPLTPNGKVDRQALARRNVLTTTARSTPFVAPRTPIEEELAQIWRELLKIEQVGVYDNFFDLGGHSLLLAQLAARLRITFHVDIPLRVLFDVPTINDMTIAIADQQLAQTDPSALADLIGELEDLSPEDIERLLAES